ncbi:hypothetical protein [Nostoc sp. 'Peltigera membranacea cyanobiont' 213]|nr:hypothetical protein [Nostoc sp. 'Peltigera membranacea cyanobiont' 213]
MQLHIKLVLVEAIALLTLFAINYLNPYTAKNISMLRPIPHPWT